MQRFQKFGVQEFTMFKLEVWEESPKSMQRLSRRQICYFQLKLLTRLDRWKQRLNGWERVGGWVGGWVH